MPMSQEVSSTPSLVIAILPDPDVPLLYPGIPEISSVWVHLLPASRRAVSNPASIDASAHIEKQVLYRIAAHPTISIENFKLELITTVRTNPAEVGSVERAFIAIPGKSRYSQ